MDVTVASDCFFIVYTSLRNLCNGSTSISPQNPVSWRDNEAAKFALCYGPRALIAQPGQDFYFRAFISGNHFPKMSNNYMGMQSTPMPTVSPCRHAALWACTQRRQRTERKSLSKTTKRGVAT